MAARRKLVKQLEAHASLQVKDPAIQPFFAPVRREVLDKALIRAARAAGVVFSDHVQAPVLAARIALGPPCRWVRERGERTGPVPRYWSERVEGAVRPELLADAGFPGLAERAPDSVLVSCGVATRFSAPGGTQ